MDEPAAAGARCARHPDRAATIVCAKCGDYACIECRFRESEYCVPHRAFASPPTPWAVRAVRGRMRGWFGTAALLVSRPYELSARIRDDEPVGDAVRYGLSWTLAGHALAWALALFCVVTGRSWMLTPVAWSASYGVLYPDVSAAAELVPWIWLLVAPVRFALTIAICAGYWWLVLAATGARITGKAVFVRVCYAAPAELLAAPLLILDMGAFTAMTVPLAAQLALLSEMPGASARRLGIGLAFLVIVALTAVVLPLL